ncbi:MAG: MBL fold metallo-hydrolase [Acidipropionibacterium jensenii]|nr:MBL fold metallo-hydrolase [Acidipropionibacterium jensenii]
MRITHLGHSCILVEAADARILIDPGNFSDGWRGLTDLTAILVTHAHPDHVDPEHIADLVNANSGALCRAEAGAVAAVPQMDADPIMPGDVMEVGGATIQAVGGRHAVIHRDIPAIGNVGYLIGEGLGTILFHPGDELDEIPHGVDVLACPAYGPWAAMKETIDFVREVGADHGFLIHDGLRNERGRSLAYHRHDEMSDTQFHDLRVGEPWQVPER